MNKVRSGKLDAVAQSTTSFVDKIILAMYRNEILQCVEDGIDDKRGKNASIPFKLVLALSIAAKMKVKTSLTNIPFAITDHRTLAELGYALYDTNGDLGTGLMRESSLRFLIDKYNSDEFISGYNNTVQNYIMPKLDIVPNIHILDCTEVAVELSNSNYEGSTICQSKKGGVVRGYKLATIRGITGDSGIIEDIRFGSISVHDLNLSEEMLKTSPVLNPGDILVVDRGFLSRDILNYLKTKRGVDIYIPLKKNMVAYKAAVIEAQSNNKWQTHPNKKRKSQKISSVSPVGSLWESNNPENDIELNACVVWNTESKGEDDKYFVFITTDMTKTARQIIKTYEIRWEVEIDYQQLKNFWQLEQFTTTKLPTIAFHIICTLLGYLFFQLYTMTPEGEQYARKSLPVIINYYIPKTKGRLIFYAGNEFAILTLIEFAEFYSTCDEGIKWILNEFIK